MILSDEDIDAIRWSTPVQYMAIDSEQVCLTKAEMALFARAIEAKILETNKHPIQPIAPDEHGVLRFKKNHIVDFLTTGKLNELATMNFPQEDYEQLAQLIGYSVSGWGTLSYVSDETYERAEAMQKRKPSIPEGWQPIVANFIHQFKRHVGGDGEFWLHELECFYEDMVKEAAPKGKP